MREHGGPSLYRQSGNDKYLSREREIYFTKRCKIRGCDQLIYACNVILEALFCDTFLWKTIEPNKSYSSTSDPTSLLYVM